MKKKVVDPILETIATYDSVAQEYKKRYETYGDQNHMQSFLDKFISFLKKGAVVLDIGSGAGFDSKYLVDKGLKVTGIDLSDEMLKVAREIVPEAVFMKMDMGSLDFPQESFDGVWASASLVHVPRRDIKKVILEIKRVLKPQGIVYLSLKQGMGEKFVVNKGKGNLEGARRFFSYYQKEEVVKLIEGNGYKLIGYGVNKNRENIWMNFFSQKK